MGLRARILHSAPVYCPSLLESLEKPPGKHLWLDPVFWLELAICHMALVAQRHSCWGFFHASSWGDCVVFLQAVFGHGLCLFSCFPPQLNYPSGAIPFFCEVLVNLFY